MAGGTRSPLTQLLLRLCPLVSGPHYLHGWGHSVQGSAFSLVPAPPLPTKKGPSSSSPGKESKQRKQCSKKSARSKARQAEAGVCERGQEGAWSPHIAAQEPGSPRGAATPAGSEGKSPLVSLTHADACTCAHIHVHAHTHAPYTPQPSGDSVTTHQRSLLLGRHKQHSQHGDGHGQEQGHQRSGSCHGQQGAALPLGLPPPALQPQRPH